MKKTRKTKSKIGIWARVKNVLNNSPWHSAFTYPIAYMILSALIAAGFFSIGFENIGVFFLLIFYFTPLWVLFGLIVSKRRFPYLLSLIIGLGIPIFLGYFAFKGFEGSAKIMAQGTWQQNDFL